LRLASIRDEIAFGVKAASASVLYHFYRNLDYYFLGRFLGMSAVGTYRVAFDLAMTPTQAVLTVVNRSALPVYARLFERPNELRAAFLWTLRSMGILVAPVTALLVFAAEDLLSWVDGGKWIDAAPMVRWLALAALVRCLAQTFPPLFHALRRPTLALYDSLLTALLLCALLYVGIRGWGEQYGPVVASWAWTALYPITLLVLIVMARALMPLPLRELARTLAHAVGMFLVMAGAHALFQYGLRPRLPSDLGPVLNIAVLSFAFIAYVRIVMGVTLRSLTRAPRPP
ncbi:MAG TPA: oligosaccharide flippase family protein, partial [Polyangiales bacterium]